MCGFAGVFSGDPRSVPPEAALSAMAGALVLRGPDDGAFEIAPGGALAFRRLAIIDVDGGRQPFRVADGSVVAVVNGEIYDWRVHRAALEARGVRFATQSDCEIVPHLYLEHGPAFIERLTGMFALAIIDRRGPVPKLVLGRDRLGIKPLYWIRTGTGDIAFASEPKALLAGGFAQPVLRGEALLDYLVQGYVGGPDAAYAGMQRLPPGHVLTADAGSEPVVRRWWDLPLDSHAPRTGAADVLALLDRVVVEHMMADVPLGAFLSGGIDSNAVVDSMARQSATPVVACSVGFAERSHDELDIARRSALRIGARHHTEVLVPDPRDALRDLPWIFCEPHADPSCLPTWWVSRMARRHVTVALSGDGGDETFAGYRRYVHDAAENRLRRRLGAGGVRVAGALARIAPRSPRWPRPLRAGTFLANLARDPAAAYWNSVTPLSRAAAMSLLAPALAASLGSHDPMDAFRAHYERPRIDDPLYRAQYADFHTYLPDQILAKVDRASMGCSLEVRVPLLDHRFVERFAPLPPEQKVAHGRGKVAFREALRGRLPGEVLDAPKRGFDTPLSAWLSGPLAAPLADALATLPARWFHRPALERLHGEHRARRRDHSRTLWGLLVLEHWRRRHGVSEVEVGACTSPS